MVSLKQNEKILMTLHKHWLVLAGRVVAILLLATLPLPTLFFFENMALVFFCLSLWWLVLLLIFFIEWLNYWLDAWVITDTRIIDIEQRGLFHRETSEFAVSRVQDVTTSVEGVLATFLKFGDITVQTAGEMSFTAYAVPLTNEAKNLILDLAAKSNKTTT
ncbi:MAG: PH domain-containing protein [Candidatus Ryanbacteria bacterium]|nr:PH domain-containing protein [Candidatus Ryanbacteria bacterium]